MHYAAREARLVYKMRRPVHCHQPCYQGPLPKTKKDYIDGKDSKVNILGVYFGRNRFFHISRVGYFTYIVKYTLIHSLDSVDLTRNRRRCRVEVELSVRNTLSTNRKQRPLKTE